MVSTGDSSYIIAAAGDAGPSGQIVPGMMPVVIRPSLLGALTYPVRTPAITVPASSNGGNLYPHCLP